MPNKKKKYNARFPPARIKKIMQKDEEVGKVAAAVPVIISRSLELFVESLIKKASEITLARNAKTLTTTHLYGRDPMVQSFGQYHLIIFVNRRTCTSNWIKNYDSTRFTVRALFRSMHLDKAVKIYKLGLKMFNNKPLAPAENLVTLSEWKQCILAENQFDFLKDLVASVPDVQVDDDSSNPPSADIFKTSSQSNSKRPRVHHRARKKNDAGPSQTTTESDEEDSEEEDDEEDEEDEEEDSRSEDNSLPPKSNFLNSQAMTNNVRVNASPNGATSVIVNPVAFTSFTTTPTSLMPNSAHLDEDYDS